VDALALDRGIRIRGAQRVEPALLQAGWWRQRTVFLIWRDEPEPVALQVSFTLASG
jgi:hypothetical protein